MTVAELVGHTNTVTVGSAVYIPAAGGVVGDVSRTLVATASVDSTIRIWQRQQNQGMMVELF